ncbi:alpha/beta hydrolase [Micromonospora cathayae]|uniref:Alpha/beta hydrolase n=1 Tax=Micromonospora cathayae TaxID=3028804 RepID=A0ABY7ZRX5_9ACTN|nr:alpha/beta hydrolase [Micromonospora sp. HUAS 3]WDZ85790.1 alpha/beta hydrolase [Micromonospora sp. HUAS 3]
MRRFTKILGTAVLTLLVGGPVGGASASSGSVPGGPGGPPPGTAAWLADDSLGRRLPDPATATPSEVAAFFGGLTTAQQQRLVVDHPGVVGNLDGAPVALRYQANAPAGDRVLAYDPRGRGLIAQVVGDLENAAQVAVIVPGSDIDLSTFDRTARQAAHLRQQVVHLVQQAANLRQQAAPLRQPAAPLRQQAGGDTAVIAWAGYPTPAGIGLDQATGRLAGAGAERLSRFIAGLDASGLPDPTLFCHSYGSVVCGLAAAETDACDIVVLGSPGMRADHVTALDTEARIWAAKSPNDWIRRVPHVQFLGLGHGADPTSPDFGATVLPADDVPAHDAYFTPGTSTLTAFAAIVAGAPR